MSTAPAATPAPARGASAAAFDAFEAAGWARAAAAYQRFFAPITRRLVAPILDGAGVGPATRLLDVACGPGHLAAVAGARGALAIGVDVAGAMVAAARAAHPGLEVREGDAQHLAFPAAAFDVVVASFALMHLAEPDRAVAEMARVVAPGGRAAVTVWDVPERARLFGWILEAVEAAGAEAPAGLPEGIPFFRFADEAELAGLLGAGGFGAVSVSTVAFTHFAASSEAIWAGVVEGSVRTAALIRGQAPAVQHRIRRHFDALVGAATTGDGVAIPLSVKLAVASR